MEIVDGRTGERVTEDLTSMRLEVCLYQCPQGVQSSVQDITSQDFQDVGLYNHLPANLANQLCQRTARTTDVF